MVFQNDFVEKVKREVSLESYISRYVRLKRAGKRSIGLCPLHSEKAPSFSVSNDLQLYHCFGCGEHGSAITFVMQYSGLNFVDAVKDLAQNAGMVVPEEKHILPEQREQQKTRMIKNER